MEKIMGFFKKKLDSGSSFPKGSGERLGNREENEAQKAISQARALQEIQAKKQLQQQQLMAAQNMKTEANVRAAQAALHRMEVKNTPRTGTSSGHSSTQIEDERYKRQLAQAQALAERFALPKEVHLEKPNAATQILFTCEELFGGEDDFPPLPKEKLIEQVAQYCRASMLSNPEGAALSAVLLLYTCNPPVRVNKCTETLITILTNAKEHPEEEKYRKLRCENKRLADEVFSLQGALDFLQAVGFEVSKVSRGNEASSEEEMETLLILPLKVEPEHLTDMINVLKIGEPVPFTLFRDTRAYKITGQISLEKAELPDEFYAITDEDMRKEYAKQQQIVEETGMLMTKAMRERLQQKELRRYNYCLVRVRFPDNTMLQGTFEAKESITCVMEWISSCIQHPELPYQLHSFGRARIHELSGSLAELKLTPMVVLNFSQLKSDGTSTSGPFLNDKWSRHLIPL